MFITRKLTVICTVGLVLTSYVLAQATRLTTQQLASRVKRAVAVNNLSEAVVAAQSLADRGPSGTRTLITLLEADDAKLIEVAATGLARAGTTEAATALLNKIGSTDNLGFRENLISICEGSVATEALPTFLDVLRSEAPDDVQQLAVRVLASSADDRALDQLADLIQDATTPAHVKRRGYQVFERITDPALARPLAQRLNRTQNEQLTMAYAVALASIGTPDALRSIAELYPGTTHDRQEQLSNGIVRVRHPDALPVLQDLFTGSHEDGLREAIAIAFGNYQNSALLTAMERYTATEHSPRVRDALRTSRARIHNTR